MYSAFTGICTLCISVLFIWNPNVYFSLQVKFNTAHASQFIQIKEFKSKFTLQSQIVQLELPIQNALYTNEYDFWDMYCKPTFIHRREIFARFAGASLLWKFLDVNLSVPDGCK